jgi:hypothetical protein
MGKVTKSIGRFRSKMFCEIDPRTICFFLLFIEGQKVKQKMDSKLFSLISTLPVLIISGWFSTFLQLILFSMVAFGLGFYSGANVEKKISSLTLRTNKLVCLLLVRSFIF